MFEKNKKITKVIWKTKFTPTNAPASKMLTDEYEVTTEFKICKNDLSELDKKYKEYHESDPDRVEIYNSNEDKTNFDIKIKTIHCDYDQLKSKLGYEPDALEFDQHLKKQVKNYKEKIFKTIKVDKVS